MKAKIFFPVITCILISIATINIILNQQGESSLSTLALANLNALAETENGENPGGGENSGTGDPIYRIEKEFCKVNVTSEKEVDAIYKLFNIKAKVGASVDLTDVTIRYYVGGGYRLGSERTCAFLVSSINSDSQK